MSKKTLMQPKGLPILALSEVWERFGFYCVQALLVLYLTNILHFSDDRADSLYSAFSALLYAAPVAGGFLADRVLGFRKAIIFGAILYIFGYGLTAVNTSYAFYLALALLVCGNGYFKANVSSLLGTLYTDDDPRRDSGFTWFYLGINLGVLFGPVISSLVAVHFGYLYGFAVAGIGIFIGLITFIYGRRYLEKHGTLPSYTSEEKAHIMMKKFSPWVYFLTLVSALLLSLVIPFSQLMNVAILVFCALAIGYAFIVLLSLPNKQDRKKLLALIILFIFSIMFWSMYMQMFTSITLFAERDLNRSFFGWTIPTPMLQSTIAIFLIILSPLMAKLWLKLSNKPYCPSFGMKFFWGHVFQGLCFIALIIGINFNNPITHQVALFWLFFSAFLRAIGELCLSPIGLSAVTVLAPAELTGMMMGIWFLTLAGGLVLSGYLAQIAAVSKHLINDPVVTLHLYKHAFLEFAIISFITAIVLLALTPILKRLSGEETATIKNKLPELHP